MTTIIRASDRHAVVHSAAFNFDDLGGQAEKYLAGIREEAKKILARAAQEADGIRRAAEQAGRQAAAAEIRREVAEQLAPALAAIQQSIGAIQAERPGFLAHWERQAIDVAAAIAARIVRRQLPHMPEVPVELAREALQLAARGGAARVRMNPEDCRSLADELASLAAEFSRLAPTEIVPDPAIERGACRVETDYGVIDQQFTAQLERIRSELV